MPSIKPFLRPLKKILEKRFNLYLYLTPPHGISLSNDIKRLLANFNVQVILDVGANIGQSAKEFRSSFPKSSIHCFEPSADHYQKLKDSAARLHGVNAYNLAIGSTIGSKKLVHADDPTMHHISTSECIGDSFEIVQMTTLDEFCAREGISRVSILKIDTEGHELSVLDGAARLLESTSVDLVYLEAGMNQGNKMHAHISDICERLIGYGYQPFGVYEQKHEWLSNQPVLRRSNVAFISRELASRTIAAE